MSDEEFREAMEEAVREYARDEFRQDVWDWLAAGMRYVAARLLRRRRARTSSPACLARARRGSAGTRGNRLFYLSVPPERDRDARRASSASGATHEGWTRLIIEKPFGHDLASARELNALLQQYFDENEVFRIDHYLGKETVQNMLALRFANGIFEPIWNRQFIDHVQITVAESMGIEGRAAFYEQAGAIRDIVQNHLLQLARAAPRWSRRSTSPPTSCATRR